MADLLIKDKKMPKNCSYCDLYDLATDWCEAINDEILGFDPLATRFSGCPLVEVPTHGRLIDAGELMKDLFRRRCGVTFTNKEVWDALESAPTVIEASEDGEQDGKL